MENPSPSKVTWQATTLNTDITQVTNVTMKQMVPYAENGIFLNQILTNMLVCTVAKFIVVTNVSTPHLISGTYVHTATPIPTG